MRSAATSARRRCCSSASYASARASACAVCAATRVSSASGPPSSAYASPTSTARTPSWPAGHAQVDGAPALRAAAGHEGRRSPRASRRRPAGRRRRRPRARRRRRGRRRGAGRGHALRERREARGRVALRAQLQRRRPAPRSRRPARARPPRPRRPRRAPGPSAPGASRRRGPAPPSPARAARAAAPARPPRPAAPRDPRRVCPAGSTPRRVEPCEGRVGAQHHAVHVDQHDGVVERVERRLPLRGDRARRALGPARAEHRAHGRHQHGVVRLRQVRVGAGVEAHRAAARVVRRGGEVHDRGVRRARVGPQAAGDLDPVDVRQLDVEQHGVGPLAACRLEPRGAVAASSTSRPSSSRARRRAWRASSSAPTTSTRCRGAAVLMDEPRAPRSAGGGRTRRRTIPGPRACLPSAPAG